MSDEIASHYVAKKQTENGWSVYRVRSLGNWHDRVRGDLSENDAHALVAKLEAEKA